MPYRAERISGRCRSAGHPAPPSKQPPGQGAPYVSEGNVKIHNRQDGNNQKLWRVTKTETQGEFCRVVCLKDDGIIVWAGEYEHIYVKNVDVALDIKPLQTVVIDFSESDLQRANGTFTDSFGDEQTHSYILESPKSIRHTTSEEPTFG